MNLKIHKFIYLLERLNSILKVYPVPSNYKKYQLGMIDNELVDGQTIFQKVKEVIQANKEADLFHKAFLKPIQIQLRTWKTQKDPQLKGSLPYGILQIIKKDIGKNKFESDTIKSFGSLDEDKRKDYQFLTNNNYDNLLSLIKEDDRPSLRVAICVCMYSQDKNQLKKTFNGIANNIATFVKNGIPSDQIGVFFIMDGIDVVNESVVEFFGEMEKQNGIYLQDDVQPSKADDLASTELRQLDEDEVLNVNNFIFDKPEFDDRKKRRFAERKRQYRDVQSRIKDIEKMEKDKTITFESMSQWLIPYFFSNAREKHKSQYACDAEEMKRITDADLIEQYGNNINKSRRIIRKALGEAKRDCQEYLTSREDLALLNSFRVEIDLNVNEQREGEDHQNNSAYLVNNRDEEQVGDNTTKMNVFMVTKYKNRGKLSSHNWFFNGFCKEFNPQFAILLDVGLAPEKDALYKMVRYMMNERKVGGVCGYMGLRIERLEDNEQVQDEDVDCFSSMFLKLVDIQRAQQLEYHFAHLVDKPFQSMYDFIHVLPGAFSAYRMRALGAGDDEDSPLLKQYFKSLEEVSDVGIKKSQFTVPQTIAKVVLPDMLYYCCYPRSTKGPKTQQQLLYDKNVYLAEDRTLCMGIHQNGYTLEYLPDAYAWVDPMKTLYGILGQRKRWINGSFFAFEMVRETLNESAGGSCCLGFQMLFLTFLNMLAYVSPALFLFTAHVAMIAFRIYILEGGTLSNYFQGWGVLIIYTVDLIYVMLFLTLIFFSMHLTNKHKKFIPYIYATSTLLGILAVVIFVLLGFEAVTSLTSNESIILNNETLMKELADDEQIALNILHSLTYVIIGTFFLYAIPIILYAILYKKCSFIVDIVFSAISFMFYGPTYLEIFNIYALCRIDDISWGTKGLDTEANSNKKQREETWKKIKLIHVSKYVFWNIITGFILLSLGGSDITRFFVTYVIMAILVFTLLVKIILAVVYMIKYKCSSEPVTGTIRPVDQNQKIKMYFNQIKRDLYADLKKSITGIQEDCREQNIDIKEVLANGGSQVHQIGRKRAIRKQNFNFQNKMSMIEVRSRRVSAIVQTRRKKKQPQPVLKEKEDSKVQMIPNDKLESTQIERNQTITIEVDREKMQPEQKPTKFARKNLLNKKK